MKKYIKWQEKTFPWHEKIKEEDEDDPKAMAKFAGKRKRKEDY